MVILEIRETDCIRIDIEGIAAREIHRFLDVWRCVIGHHFMYTKMTKCVMMYVV